MDILSSRPQTAVARDDWFTGTAYIDGLAPEDMASRLRAYRVHFTPASRTAWHSHPHGQLLHITDGVGRVQTRGGQVQQVVAGDTVRFEPGEEHWHGAAPANFMTHIAFQMADDEGRDVTWGEHVTDAEYAAAG